MKFLILLFIIVTSTFAESWIYTKGLDLDKIFMHKKEYCRLDTFPKSLIKQNCVNYLKRKDIKICSTSSESFFLFSFKSKKVCNQFLRKEIKSLSK